MRITSTEPLIQTESYRALASCKIGPGISISSYIRDLLRSYLPGTPPYLLRYRWKLGPERTAVHDSYAFDATVFSTILRHGSQKSVVTQKLIGCFPEDLYLSIITSPVFRHSAGPPEISRNWLMMSVFWEAKIRGCSARYHKGQPELEQDFRRAAVANERRANP